MFDASKTRVNPGAAACGGIIEHHIVERRVGLRRASARGLFLSSSRIGYLACTIVLAMCKTTALRPPLIRRRSVGSLFTVWNSFRSNRAGIFD